MKRYRLIAESRGCNRAAPAIVPLLIIRFPLADSDRYRPDGGPHL
jgi:hypothetical protein